MLDLMKIARTEADGGDLEGLLGDLFDATDVRPTGYPDATVWQGGNHDGKINPIAHSIGTRKVIDPPHMVAIHEKIFTPVGTAITIVAAVK